MKPTILNADELRSMTCSTCGGKQISIYMGDTGSYPYCKNCYQEQMARLNPDQSEKFKKATERAEQMVKQCYYDLPITGANSIDQAKTFETVDDIFNALTQELALVLPSDFRTANALECLEEACMWAKKAIAIYFKEKDKNATAISNTH